MDRKRLKGRDSLGKNLSGLVYRKQTISLGLINQTMVENSSGSVIKVIFYYIKHIRVMKKLDNIPTERNNLKWS